MGFFDFGSSKGTSDEYGSGSILDGFFNFGGGAKNNAKPSTKSTSSFGRSSGSNSDINHYDARNYETSWQPMGTQLNATIAPSGTRWHDEYGNPHDTEQEMQIANLKIHGEECLNCEGKGCFFCGYTGRRH